MTIVQLASFAVLSVFLQAFSAGIAFATGIVAIPPVSALISDQASNSKSIPIDIQWSKSPPDVHGCRTFHVDLKEQFARDKIDLELSITNDSEDQIVFANSNVTCGCISQPPQDVKIASKDTFRHAFSLELPIKVGPLKKQITFFSVGGEPLLELQLSTEVIPPIELPTAIDVTKEENQVIRIPAKNRRPDLRSNEVQVFFFGPEITNAEFDSKQEQLALSIEPKNNPGVAKTVLPVEIRVDGVAMCKTEVLVRYSHRVSLSPSQLIWKPISSTQKVRSQLLVRHKDFRTISLSKSNFHIDLFDEKKTLLPIQVDLLPSSKVDGDGAHLHLQTDDIPYLRRAHQAVIKVNHLEIAIPCELLR